MLRPGNAGSNTAADHITVTRKALAQLPGHTSGNRPGRKILIRSDAAGATHAFVDWLTKRRLSYSLGFTLGDIADVLAKVAASCERDGFPFQIAEPVWRALMNGCISYEFEVFDAANQTPAKAIATG